MTTPELDPVILPYEESLDPVLEQWLEDVPALIAGLSLRLPAGMPLDLSRQSLVELNAFALVRFPDKQAVLADDELTRDLVVRLTAYLGETLLTAGGGRWLYETDPSSIYKGHLIVQPADDDAFPTAPRTILTSVVIRRLGDGFVKPYDKRVRRVAELRAADPSWRPWRMATSGLTEVPVPASPEHDAWVAGTDRALAAYVATLPPATTWDLSPESLDALEEALLARYPDVAAWRAASEAERDGPIRYVGETIRRAVGGQWATYPGFPDDEQMPAGQRFLEVGPRGDVLAVPPDQLVERLVRRRERGRLRTHPAFRG